MTLDYMNILCKVTYAKVHDPQKRIDMIYLPILTIGDRSLKVTYGGIIFILQIKVFEVSI